ncbi:MAG TPA: hypothetical protein VM261_02755 [Kofleriaceae bacterium]|nr:hypothetical protein [Kofleriaceae bacterium]
MRATAVGSMCLAVGVVSASPSADAECAMPDPVTAPEAQIVPPDPVIYRFDLQYAAPPVLTIEGPDGPMRYTASGVGPHNDIRAMEIHIEATSGSFTVSGGDHDVPKTYVIGPVKPPVAPVVESVQWMESSWTCSHERGFAIDARGADVAAFRVVWSNGYEELIPPNSTAFFSRMSGGERDPNALRAFIGHPNCVGNLVNDHYIGRKDFRLFARYSDGTELEVELPREPQPPPPPPPQPQPQPQTKPQPQPQAKPAPPSRGELAPWKVGVAAAMSIAALSSVSTLLVARRRRRYAAMVP